MGKITENDGIIEEKLNGLRIPTKPGQPNWGTIFVALTASHDVKTMICVSPSLDCKGLKCEVMDSELL